MLSLPSWPQNAFFEHGLSESVDLFIDESGPRAGGTCALGILLVECALAEAAAEYLEWFASELEHDHPALTSAAYGGEWKGRLLARSVSSAKERRAVGRGELLSDVGRQSVYARCLYAIREAPGARALSITYGWSGTMRGPANQAGYRVRRIIQFALAALAFHGVQVRHAYIDDGHRSHYSAGIEEYANKFSTGAVPHEYVHSNVDRRIQMADLIAFAAHTSRFPDGTRIFPTASGWLNGFAGRRLLRIGNDPDHHVTEP